MQLIECELIPQDDIRDMDNNIFEKLKKRCYELMEKYPEKKASFFNYVKR